MRWSETFYHPIFGPYGFVLKENDYVIDDRKFGGNAQYLTKHRWLHHTSLLWDFKPENMRYLKLPKRQPKYREQRDHLEFLCGLKTYFPKMQHLVDVIESTLYKTFHVQRVEMEDLSAMLNTSHRKTTQYVSPITF